MYIFVLMSSLFLEMVVVGFADDWVTIWVLHLLEQTKTGRPITTLDLTV